MLPNCSLDGKDLGWTRLLEAEPAQLLIRVFIPGLARDGRRVPRRFLRHRVEDHFTRLAGGATSFPGIGVYLNRQGLIQRERVSVVEAGLNRPLSADERRSLARLVSWVGKVADQECVAMILGRMHLLLLERDPDGGEVRRVVPAQSLEGTADR